MTKKEKNLLLKDLCSRLPFGVKVKHLLDTYPSDLLCIDAEKNVVYVNHYGSEGKYKIECIRPYLRSMDSMTNEEREEFRLLGGIISYNPNHNTYSMSAFSPEAYDWLNKNMFDYRGLIPKGLALEAPEGMYNS